MAELLTPDADGNVSFAGHKFPAPLALRIIKAIRGSYPSIVEGKSDPAAVRAVIRYWFVTTLANFEGRLAEAPVDEVVEAARSEYATKAKKAREKAERDAASIIEVQDPPPPVT